MDKSLQQIQTVEIDDIIYLLNDEEKTAQFV